MGSWPEMEVGGWTSLFPGDQTWLENPWNISNLWMMFGNPRNVAFNIGHY